MQDPTRTVASSSSQPVRAGREADVFLLSSASLIPALASPFASFYRPSVPTPWLDDKHTIFGRATGGFDVIHAIENARTERSTDKPEQDISACG